MTKNLIKNAIKSFILLNINFLFAQSAAQFKAVTVAFYNVENLFDTKASIDYIDGEKHPKDPLFHRSISIDDPLVAKTPAYKGPYLDEIFIKKKLKALRPQILNKDFTPEGKKNWTPKRYQAKLKNLAQVISQIGKDFTGGPPVAVGLAEVENREVVEDLIKQEALKFHNYGIIHKNSYDIRGIDCAFIYRRDRLKVKNFETIDVPLYGRYDKREYTRDILFVEALLDGEKMYFVINHWPSRMGGETFSAHKRKKAAKVLKEKIVDLLFAKDPRAKIIIMGDFNDDPTSPSIKKVLKTRATKKNLKPISLYNPMEDIFRRGGGTAAYKDKWNCFDQIIFSGSLLKKNQKRIENDFRMYKVGIFRKKFLLTPSGSFKNYPFRTYAGNNHLGGYSDHFPVFTILIKKNN